MKVCALIILISEKGPRGRPHRDVVRTTERVSRRCIRALHTKSGMFYVIRNNLINVVVMEKPFPKPLWTNLLSLGELTSSSNEKGAKPPTLVTLHCRGTPRASLP